MRGCMNGGANNVGFVDVAVAILVHVVDCFSSSGVNRKVGIVAVHWGNDVSEGLQEGCMSV